MSGLQSFAEYISEAEQKTWTVKFKRGTYSGVKVTNEPHEVKARTGREAIVKVGKQLGLSKDNVLAIDAEVSAK